MIYVRAFRTILNDCRELIISVINEFFCETIAEEEEIRFFPNEHFLDQHFISLVSRSWQDTLPIWSEGKV